MSVVIVIRSSGLGFRTQGSYIYVKEKYVVFAKTLEKVFSRIPPPFFKRN